MKFYKTLTDPQTDVFVVKPPPTVAETQRIKTFVLDNRIWIPFYSSLRQLRAANSNLPYLEFKCLPFLQLAHTQKKNLFLNARAPFAKELPFEEICALMDGSIFQPFEYAPDQPWLPLGEPTAQPEFLSVLKQFFSSKESVQKAHLALYLHPRPKFLVAVDVPESEWQDLIEGVVLVLKGCTSVPSDSVDFIRMSSDSEALRNYFAGAQPFYSK